MGRFGLIFKSIAKGRVTEKYPFAPIELPEGFRGKPEIDPEKCIGCGACATVCPPSAIQIHVDEEQGYKTIDLFLGRCIFCARCEEVCPAEAIRLTKEFELAAASEEDLHQVVRLKMVKCAGCGRPFDTVRHLQFIAEKLPEEQKPMLALCPDCKAKLASKILTVAARRHR